MTEHSNMKTILYNTTDKKLGRRFNPQYLVDGKPGKLPSNMIELAIVETEPPAATSEHNARVYDGGTYTTITSAAWAARTEAAVCVYGNRIENM